MGRNHDLPSHDPADRATEILRAVMLLAAEVALDLELTSDEVRELFASVLVERAEQRFGSAAAVAAALATTSRTVVNYRKRRHEPPTPHLFNIRRRVLHVLDRAPADYATIEQCVPHGSDTGLAKSALRSLIKDGLVVKDERLGRYRRKNIEFQPWYLRAQEFPEQALELFFAHMARHVGSRFTPLIEDGSTPASMCAVMANIPEDRLRDYVDEFYDVMAQFDARWSEVERDTTKDTRRVFVGCEAVFGRLGPPMDETEMASLSELAAGPVWDTAVWTERKAMD